MSGEQIADFKAEIAALKIANLGLRQKAEQAEKRVKEVQLVGYKCEHIAKNEIDGDCVHCNLVVAEGANECLQERVKEWEAERSHPDPKIDLDEQTVGVQMVRRHRLDELTSQLEEANERWRNAEDANIKLCENIVEYRKRLDAVATEEWDKLKDQNARLKEALELILVEGDSCVIRHTASDALQQLSNQGDGRGSHV